MMGHLGSPEAQGIIPRLCLGLFERMHGTQRENPSVSFKLEVRRCPTILLLVHSKSDMCHLRTDLPFGSQQVSMGWDGVFGWEGCTLQADNRNVFSELLLSTYLFIIYLIMMKYQKKMGECVLLIAVLPSFAWSQPRFITLCVCCI